MAADARKRQKKQERLNDRCGPGGFHYHMPMGSSEFGASLLSPEDEEGWELAAWEEDAEILCELDELDDDDTD